VNRVGCFSRVVESRSVLSRRTLRKKRAFSKEKTRRTKITHSKDSQRRHHCRLILAAAKFHRAARGSFLAPSVFVGKHKQP
jgi:hypothetical protein